MSGHDAIEQAWHEYHGPIKAEGEEDYFPVLPPLFKRGFLDGVEYAKRERDETRAELSEWQTLRLWGAEPPNIHDFIKGQQIRIYETQDMEKTCDQLKRERDEARALLERKWDKEDPPLIRMMNERDEAIAARKSSAAHWLNQVEQANARVSRALQQVARAEQDRDEAREESLEQARLLGKGGEREARLITERDHYKDTVEEISITIQDWLDSIVQEPSLDFIKAIKAWADKKLNNG